MARSSIAALVAGAAASFACGTVAAFANSAALGPKQYFTGTINGSTGRPNPVEIRMACFGPVRPGETGHPMSGQTVAVHRVPKTVGGSGYTGTRGTAIGAFFGAPPPSGSGGSSYVRFTSYGQKLIPTSLYLPCNGSGTVSFVSLPLDPSARDFTVPVRFIGQP
jgi:hypothetical protein